MLDIPVHKTREIAEALAQEKRERIEKGWRGGLISLRPIIFYHQRLSLRKKLKTGKFELYQVLLYRWLGETIFTGSPEECLRRAEEGWKRSHFGWG